MTSTPLTIAVVGAGIGGLTAAVALRQAGFDASRWLYDFDASALPSHWIPPNSQGAAGGVTGPRAFFPAPAPRRSAAPAA